MAHRIGRVIRYRFPLETVRLRYEAGRKTSVSTAVYPESRLAREKREHRLDE